MNHLLNQILLGEFDKNNIKIVQDVYTIMCPEGEVTISIISTLDSGVEYISYATFRGNDATFIRTYLDSSPYTSLDSANPNDWDEYYFGQEDLPEDEF